MSNLSVEESIGLSSQVRCRAVGDEGVLVHLESGRVIVVNEVGLYIVQQLQLEMTAAALASSIAVKFDISAEQAGIDLDVFLTELNQERVLTLPQ